MTSPPDPAQLRQFWQAACESFDPLKPVTDPKLRVPRKSAYSPAEQFVPKLLTPLRARTFLVAGGIGSGKSTELLAIAERLAVERIPVVFDLWRHMDRSVKDAAGINHLQPWELIGLVGLAVLRAGTERFGHDWADADTALATALREVGGGDVGASTLDIAKLATGLAVAVGGAAGTVAGGPAAGVVAAGAASAGLQALKAVGGAWSWKVGLQGRQPRGGQDEGVRGVLQATCALIDSLQAGLGRRVVVIVDGLDRVHSEEGFKDLLVDSELLRDLPCDVVVSAHLALVQRYRANMRFDKRSDLANEPVADSTDPWEHGAGVAFFRKLVDLRLAALAKAGIRVPANVFPDDVVGRLAWCSGGSLRDFVGLAQGIAEECILGAPRVERPLVESVIDAARRQKSSGLDDDQIRVLQGIAHDPNHRLPGGEVALKLLEQQLILLYPNEDVWYLPHPLLMLTLIPRGSAASGASSP